MSKKHVFLSYFHEDAENVAKLREELLRANESVWWDRDILPGQDWKLAIRKAMKESYAVVLCLSGAMANRFESGIFTEAVDAIAEYRRYKPDSVFLIPVRLSMCDVPPVEIDDTRTLDRLQYVDLFPPTQRATGVKRLVEALQTCPGHPVDDQRHAGVVTPNGTDFPVRPTSAGTQDSAAGTVSITRLLESPPYVRFFTGRGEDLQRVRRFLEGDKPICFVGGLAGAGKSALVARALADPEVCKHKTCLWTSVSTRRSIGAILHDLAVIADSKRHFGLIEWLHESARDPSEMPDGFLARLKSWPLVLVIDDADEDASSWLEPLIVAFDRRSMGQKLILIARRRPQALTAISARSTEHLVLQEGLSLEDTKAFLRSHEVAISSDQYDSVWERTGLGFPLALEIFVGLVDCGKHTCKELLYELQNFDQEQHIRWFDVLMNELSDLEKHHLRCVSIFEAASRPQAVAAVCGNNYSRSCLDELHDRFMISRRNGSYVMHRLLQVHCKRELPDSEAKKLHGRAAEHFLGLADPNAAKPLGDREIEGLLLGHYHLLKAEAITEAVHVVRQLQSELMKRGRYGELLEITDRTLSAYGVPDIGLLLYKAKVYACWGESAKCRQVLGQIRSRGGRGEIAESLLIELDLLVRVERDFDSAMHLIEEELPILRDRARPDIISRMLVRRAAALGGKGDLPEAMQLLSSLLAIQERKADRVGEAKCLKEMGILYADWGDDERAKECYLEAAAIFKIADHRAEAAAALLMLGQLHLQNDEHGLAQARGLESQHLLETVDRIDLCLLAEQLVARASKTDRTPLYAEGPDSISEGAANGMGSSQL